MLNKNVISFAHTPLGGLGAKYLLNNEIFTTIGDRIGKAFGLSHSGSGYISIFDEERDWTSSGNT